METQANSCPSCGQGVDDAWRCPRCGALIESHGFRVEGLLAQSPRGRVYRARRGYQLVALKELAFATVPDSKTIERFEREGELLRQLIHPGIPATVAAFSEGEGPGLRLYLAQTFMPGLNLEQRLERHRFSEEEVRRVAKDVLEILHYLHTRSPQLIHRDVKPSNIIARPEGTHALVDFGAVRDRSKSSSSSSGLGGTFGYMPPEMLARHADPRSDLYALGMTLLQLLSRREVGDLYTPDLVVNFRPYVNASPSFTDFLEGLVARSREARFKSAGKALSVLEKLPAVGSEPLDERDGKPKVTTVVSLDQVSAGPPQLEATRPRRRSIEWIQARSPQVDASGGHPWCLNLRGKLLGLRPGYCYQVGRSRDADIRIDDSWPEADTVSRKHATLAAGRRGLVVEDSGSSNGTRVGSVLLVAQSVGMVLRDEADILFGRFGVRVSPWTG